MEQDVMIRSARPADMPAVAAAYEWLFAPPGRRPPHWDQANAVRALHEVSSSDRSDVLIADVDGHPVGFCTVYLDIRSVRFGYPKPHHSPALLASRGTPPEKSQFQPSSDTGSERS